MENVIQVRNVYKKFKDEKEVFYALEDISLNIRKGEIFGLLGPNGAGKSTLLNVMMHLLLPDKGEVLVFGKKPGMDIYQKIGFVSGEAKFHWALKSIDVLNFYSMIYGIPKKEREKRIQELAELFDIKEILDKKFEVLSTGERMRLSFAKALLNKPELLLLDEPTLGLDPDISIKIRNEIKKINKDLGVTILLTSHYMPEVEQLADRIAFIHKGKILEQGEIKVLKSKHFADYNIIVHARKITLAGKLKELGFKISGKKIMKTLTAGEDINEVLKQMNNLGIEIEDIEIKRPTLEDYFIKMSGRDAGSMKEGK